MEKNPVKAIKNLIQHLPEKDIKLAEKFIETRDFEALQDLVNSDVYLVEKNIKNGNLNPKYSDICIEMLNELKGIVDEYCMLLYPDNNLFLEEDDENIEEDDEW